MSENIVIIGKKAYRDGIELVLPCTDAKGKTIVRTGVSLFAFNDQGEFVVGKRKGAHGAGAWALPGGHIEFEESSLEDCAEREMREETGQEVSNVEFLTVTNDVFTAERKHYTTNFLAAMVKGDQKDPRLLEEDKCYEWKWTTWEEVEKQYRAHDAAERAGTVAKFEGEKLFLPMLNLFRQRPGFDPRKAYESITGLKFR